MEGWYILENLLRALEGNFESIYNNTEYEVTTDIDEKVNLLHYDIGFLGGMIAALNGVLETNLPNKTSFTLNFCQRAETLRNSVQELLDKRVNELSEAYTLSLNESNKVEETFNTGKKNLTQSLNPPVYGLEEIVRIRTATEIPMVVSKVPFISEYLSYTGRVKRVKDIKWSDIFNTYLYTLEGCAYLVPEEWLCQN